MINEMHCNWAHVTHVERIEDGSNVKARIWDVSGRYIASLRPFNELVTEFKGAINANR